MRSPGRRLVTRSDTQREEMCLGIHREVDEWQGPAVAVAVAVAGEGDGSC